MKKQAWEILGDQMQFVKMLGVVAAAKNIQVVSFSDIRSEHDCHASEEDGCSLCDYLIK
jgi:hypothetical protein